VARGGPARGRQVALAFGVGGCRPVWTWPCSVGWNEKRRSGGDGSECARRSAFVRGLGLCGADAHEGYAASVT
jgi:hypothetical protein